MNLQLLSNFFIIVVSAVIVCAGPLSTVKFQLVEKFTIPSHAQICSVIILPIHGPDYSDAVITYSNRLLLATTDGTVGIWNGNSFLSIMGIMHPNLKLHSIAMVSTCDIYGQSCKLFMHKAECHLTKSPYCLYSVSYVFASTNGNTTVTGPEINIFTWTDSYTSKENTVGSVLLDGSNPSILYVTIPHQMLRLQINGCPNQRAQYCVPEENPFRNETYAIGFNRLSSCYFDSILQKPVCVDLGGTHCDEIDVIYIRGHYGWPIREGRDCVNETQCHYPLYYELPHAISYPIGNLLSGFIYRGNRLSREYRDKYISIARDNIVITNIFSRNKISSFHTIKVNDLSMMYHTKFLFQDGIGNLYSIRLTSSNYYTSYYDVYALTCLI